MEVLISGKLRTVAVLVIAVAIAFAIRVSPAWYNVFTPAGVNFQDGDSWSHMRSVHDAVAHFPAQSGFDPYRVFPGGESTFADPWDLSIAAVAWLLGFGKPSSGLVDQVGAWMPAILGALLPIPLFFIVRRFFGQAAAEFSAIALTVMPNTFLWETHLGIPDHHIAECSLTLWAIALFCAGFDQQGRERLWRIAAAGVLIGLYLCVRPAGIFVPATLALASLLEPALAPLAAMSIALAGAVFLGSNENVWSRFTWLTLGGSLAVCTLAWVLGELWRKRQWPRAWIVPSAVVAIAIAAGAMAAVKPEALFSLAVTIRGYLPGGHPGDSATVKELVPLWASNPQRGWLVLFDNLGGAWIPALPALLCALPVAWKSKRPALMLCAVWCVVMTLGGVLQARMWIFGAPVVAAAAGCGLAWTIGRIKGSRPAPLQLVAGLAAVAFLLATALSPAIQTSELNGGPNEDWRTTLDWLRKNTPEPMADHGAWSRYWPRLRPGQVFSYPPSAYGILTWWDFGDLVNVISHRLPSTNGTQANAHDVAAFLAATSEDAARGPIQRLTARYAVLNPELMGDLWPTVVLWASRDFSSYQKVLFEPRDDGTGVRVMVNLPDYYRSMAVHLYYFEGRKISATPEVSVFATRHDHTQSGIDVDTIISEHKFPSEAKAREYIASNPGVPLVFGSRDPLASCVDVDALSLATRVFTSDDSPVVTGIPPNAVKVFQLRP